MHVCARTLRACVRVFVCACVRVCMRACVRAYMCPCMRVGMRLCRCCARIERFRPGWGSDQAVMSSCIWPAYQEHILRLPTDELNGPHGKFAARFGDSKTASLPRIRKFSERILQTLVVDDTKFADLRRDIERAQITKFLQRVLPLVVLPIQNESLRDDIN